MRQSLDPLPWPEELPRHPAPGLARWQHVPSNRLLDVHGDPADAELVVFSDGNHHMALAEAIRAFGDQHGLLGYRVLYLTLPPRILLDILSTGGLLVGNLVLRLRPHVMIGPAPVLDQIMTAGRMMSHERFMKSRGNVLLIRRGNPLGIQSVADLWRPGMRLFVSNPLSEAASFNVYRDTLCGIADSQGLDGSGLARDLAQGGGCAVHGDSIHHREAPLAVATDRADAAVVYYHLALRYTRVFPERLEFIALLGSPTHKDPDARANVRTSYHAGCVDGGGAWGQTFVEFLHTDTVARIYSGHGLAATDVSPQS